MRRVVAGLVMLLVVAAARPAVAVPSSDTWLEGYATAVLERELGVAPASLRVRDGVLTVNADDLGSADRERALALMKGIRGVVRVELAPGSAAVVGVSAPAPAPAPPGAEPPKILAEWQTGLLPGGALFKPLIA